MKIVLVTGSAGLVGSEAVEFFAGKFDRVVGVDNDLRKEFFGKDASTEWNQKRLLAEVPNYEHVSLDVRDQPRIEKLFKKYSSDIALVVHAAAQPSHDWAAGNPFMDFTVNANGTLNLLEAARSQCPRAVFIFTSTNKVYGDTPNTLPLKELETRWEIEASHPYSKDGIDETMSIDASKHSLFGVSKLAGDVLTQEYGKYFGMKTGVFRCGCITGPRHSGAALHGFLSYLMKCAVQDREYAVLGYKGKQVRDNIHSRDLVSMFWHFYLNPKAGEVYNAGGSRFSNCSVLEAIDCSQKITGKPMKVTTVDSARIGDHIWWISSVRKFKSHYPEWDLKFNWKDILKEIYQAETKKSDPSRRVAHRRM